jgi:hypothetical protein
MSGNIKTQYDSAKTLYDLSGDGREANVGMIPILKYLDTGLVKSLVKPTKFIAIVCVRQEADRCKETLDTLEFAQQIKST